MHICITKTTNNSKYQMKEIFVKIFFACQALAGCHIVLCRLNWIWSWKSWIKLKQDFIVCRWFYAVTAAVTSSCQSLIINHALLFRAYVFFPGYVWFVFKEPLKSWLSENCPFFLSVKATSSLLKKNLVYCASWSLGHKLGRAVWAPTAHTLAGRNEPRQLWQTTVKPM